MTKNEFLKLTTTEIIDLLNNGNFIKQRIDNKNVFSLIFTYLPEDNIISILENRYTILNEKNEEGIVFVEYLADLGKSKVLEQYANNIDLLKRDYQGEKNMLGYLAKKGMKNVIIKALESKPTVLNEKDAVGCVGVERLADVGYEDILVQYGKYIDLLKIDYAGQCNMLGYLAKKSMKSVIVKALESKPTVLNEKDVVGCVGVERLADVGYEDVLVQYGQHIDLLKKDYQGERNMLGYLAKKGMLNAIDSALEKNPSVLNEKDVVGCIGTERLVDANAKNILEKYALNIDLLKRDYQGERNMLGYLAKKGMKNVIEKSLESNPKVLNEKDVVGCVGTERLVDSGYEDVLLKFAEHIDLLKRDYAGQYNMLGYLARKKMFNALSEIVKINPTVLNEKDSYSCLGVERLVDAGYSKIVLEHADKINFTKNATDGQNIFQYVMKKSGTEAKNIALKVTTKNPEVLRKNIKYIIDSELHEILSYQENITQLDKNMKIEDMNLLTYLTKKGRENYVVLILNPEMIKKSYLEYSETEMDFIDKTANKQLFSEDIRPVKIEYENVKENILKSNELKEQNKQEEPKTIKARIKSML